MWELVSSVYFCVASYTAGASGGQWAVSDVLQLGVRRNKMLVNLAIFVMGQFDLTFGMFISALLVLSNGDCCVG